MSVGVLLMIAQMFSGPVLAQDISGLRNEVNRLRQDMSDLQRQLAGQGGRAPAPGAAAPPSNFKQVGSESATAQLQVRIEQMDNDVRALTGQLEQANFQVSQIGQRLDKLMADIDYRLSALEGRSRGQADPSAPPGAMPPPYQRPGPQGQADQMTESIDGELSELTPPPPIGSTLESTAQAKAGGIGATLPKGSPEEQYAQAFGLLRSGDYASAASGLEAFLKANPSHELAGNATYWLGETYYVRKDYPAAGKYFLDGFQKYPKSRKGPDNLLKLGMTLAALDQKKEACQALKEIKKNYPQAPEKVVERATFERERLRCT